MGAHEKFVEDLKKSRFPSRDVPVEDRVNASMDVDEAFTDARNRLRMFVDAYLVQRKEEIDFLEGRGDPYAGVGDFYQIVHNSVYRLDSAGTSDADAHHLLLDDLRIVLSFLGESR